MGFFKKLFKRKRGGTFFGNLLRGASNTLSKGVLGNGEGLNKYWANKDQQAYDAQVKSDRAYQEGQRLVTKGANLALQTPQGQKVNNKMALYWLKNNWWKIALPLLFLIGVFYLNKNKNRR